MELASTDPAKTQSQMGQELEQLTNVVERVARAVEKLEQRLGPVLKVEPEQAVGDPPVEQLVPYADNIRGSRMKLDRVHASLVDLLGRLEV